MSRTKNSMKNIKYSIIGHCIYILANFITRMFFVRILSAEYLGLNGLFSNILSILSLAELGVGTAIIYSMYKPLAEKDNIKLKGLMNLYKQAYTSIGLIILILGMLLTPFLEFFVRDMPNIPYIRVIYIMYVLNSGVSYFFSYKRSLLIADQKKYIESFYHYSFYLMLNLLQIIILLISKKFLLYLIVQVVFTFIENIFISRKVDKLYPFLRDKDRVNLDKIERNVIFKNVKAMILHKLGSVIVLGTDNILISKFIGIVPLGLYSNYLLIINAVNQVFEMVFQSMTASIGNLGATEQGDKNIFIFNCIDLFGFWTYAFAGICLFNIFNPFINLWLGSKYLFSKTIVISIVISFYLSGRRKSVITFRNAMGIFWYDRYKPLFEAGINIIASVILAQKIGIVGVIIGTIISTLTTCFWIEPYVLFKYGFKSSSICYFIKYIVWTIIMILVGMITWLICRLFSDFTIVGFIGKLIVCAIVPNFLFLISFWWTKEFQYLANIFRNVFISRRGGSKNIMTM